MTLPLSSRTYQTSFSAFVAIVVFALSACRTDKLPAYSEAEEMKFRADQAKDMTNPRADLAYLQTVRFGDKVLTFGAGTQNDVDLAHWGTETLKLQKRADSVVVLNGPEGVALDGKPVAAGMFISTKKSGPSLITSDSISMYVGGDADGAYGRIFDGKSAPLQNLQPLKWYRPTPTYRVRAEWIPLPPGRAMVMHKTNGGKDMRGDAAGYVTFQLQGKPFKLYALIEGELIFIVFRDLTSRTDTYPAGRFLEIPFSSSAFDPSRKFDPKAKTLLALDFNQATNPLCAYNPNASCPMPIPENRLSVSIPAGEKRYHPQG